MKRAIAILAGVAVFLSLGLVNSEPASAAPCSGAQTGEITEVQVTATNVIVSGSVGHSCTSSVRIYALSASADPDSYPSLTPVVTVTPAGDKTFSATLPRLDGDNDRIYSQIVAVGNDGVSTTRLGEPHFADELTLSPPNTSSRFVPTTHKGLSVSMTGDAEELGIGNAAVSVFANELMAAGPGAAGSTMPFESGGETYYFHKKQVEWLDSTIKPLSDNGVLVYLVMVVTYDTKPNSSFPLLVHPGAPSGAPEYFATYAFNTVTPEGISAFVALMEFISSRYARDDQKYGRAMDYIIGNEINSAAVWQQMGPKTLPEFIKNYMPALRLAWQAAQKSSSLTRVYTSLDHHWNVSYYPADPLRFYKGKEVLDTLAAAVKVGGDFPWNLAYHPYPADLLVPETWNDPVTNSSSTPKITFKNIEQLPAYLNQPSMKFGTQTRHIVLSEQGCQSPSNSAADQERQAACLAYSYYKVLAAGGIDAYIWDPQVDNREAGGLRMGLWTWDDERPDYIAPPGEKKMVYDLFKYIDTDESIARTEFAKSVIGIDDWTDAIPNFTPSMIDGRVPDAELGALAQGTPTGGALVSGFESSVGDWRTANHTNAVETVTASDAPQGTHALKVTFNDSVIIKSNGTNNRSWRGVELPLSTPLDASGASVLTAAVRLPNGVAETFDPDNRFAVQIRAYGADGTVVSGVASVDPSLGWNRISIDLGGWSGKDEIVRLKVWMRGSSGQNWNGHFLLDDVRTATGISGASPANLEVVARADGRKSGSGVNITVTNNGSAALTSDLAVVNCAGISLSVPALAVTGLQGGRSVSNLSTSFATFLPVDQNFPKFCVTYEGQTIPVTVAVPQVLLYDFEDGTQGWVAQSTIASMTSVGSYPNGPQTPHGGSKVLDVVMSDATGGSPRTVSVRPRDPLVLDGASTLFAWVNAYGGAPGATGYEAKIVVFSGNESITMVQDQFKTDTWNRLSVDLSGWAYRSNVTGIDISYRALGTSANWVGGPHMQVDDIGITGTYNSQATWRAAWTAALGGQFEGDSRNNATYRQAMKVDATGEFIRIRLSNPSSSPLTIQAASVGLRSGTTAATTGTPVQLKQNGSASLVIPAGGTIYTDPVALAVTAGQDVLVSTHSSGVIPLLSHDFALKTAYVTAAGQGNRTADVSDSAFAAAGNSSYWVDAIDVYTREVSGTIVAIGDSITDGAGSDLNADNRWTNVLAARLLALPAGDANRKSIVNVGIGGGTLSSVANAQVGPNGLNRLDRDVFGQTGVTDVVVAMGTNDIFVGSSSAQVIHALTLAAQRIRDHGLRSIVSTIIPRGNGTGWTSTMETQRTAVNAWIRTQNVFDVTIDFETAVADPAAPTEILAAYDADGTHPNAAGYQAMANSIDLDIFSASRSTPNTALRTLYNFESDTQGWQAGAAVGSVSRVGSFANAPGVPAVGYGVLNAALATGPASTPKTVYIQPAGGLDLSGSREVYAWVNAYGVVGATGYAVDITVHSGTESITGTNTQFGSDRWNRVAVDVRGWDHADAVTMISITYRPLGTSTSWSGAQLQVDEVGVSSTTAPAAEVVSLFDFESGVAGWQAGTNVSGVSAVSWFPNGLHLPRSGTWALQAGMDDVNASLPRTVSVTPTTALDLSDGKALRLWFNGYGGVSGATGYTVRVTAYSGSSSVSGTIENYTSDRWSLASVPIADWAGRSAIDRIEVTYRAEGTTSTWAGGPLFQVDGVHYLR